jgi:hypothetical protein
MDSPAQNPGLFFPGRPTDIAHVRSAVAVLLTAAVGLALTAAARADTVFGAADDFPKFAEDGGGLFYSRLTAAGLRKSRITVLWDPDRPTEIADRAFLERVVPLAPQHGAEVVFVIYPNRARALTESPEALDRFVAYLQIVARAFPQVRQIIVGNEFNQPRFFQPQFGPDGSPFAGAFFAGLMARAYDALKAVDPNIVVVAGATNGRGNDNPIAPSNISTSPVRFIRDMGRGYRASARNRPIMDQLGFHPYPRVNTDSPRSGYQWPSAGIANLDRMKQAVWDAFHGTAQATFEEGLTFKIDEIAWQVAIPPSLAGLYFGTETVPTIDEATQASHYADLIRLVSCDPTVAELFFFGLVDERNLDRFQGGGIRADGSLRPSYDSIREAIAQTGGRCSGSAVVWRHTTAVIGASAEFGSLAPRPRKGKYWAFLVRAGEDYSYRASVVRVPASGRVSGGGRTPAVLEQAGQGRANLGRLVRFDRKRLTPGSYVYSIRMAAAMNPERTSFFVSRPFRVRSH